MLDRLVDDLLRYGNLIEGILWIAIGLCFTVALLRPKRRRAKLIAAANFIVFGCSDFVEYQTGAWWRPWWLMLWKGTCVCIMAMQIIAHIRGKHASE